MYRATIAVVDASRARLFTFERIDGVRGPREHLIQERDLHVEARDAKFSRTVIGELVGVLRAAHAQRVILCANPRMLGELRAAGRDLPREGVTVDELACDLVKLTPAQLRDHLASHGLLPAPPAHGKA
jgi:protein required for attachment to host cells